MNLNCLSQDVSQIISEYAVTTNKKCMKCEKWYGYVECYRDYSIINNGLANLDIDDNIRYYLNCDPSNNANKFHEDIEIVCSKCALDWQCSMCSLQYLPYSQAQLVHEGCETCRCILCQDCALLLKDQVICMNCVMEKK